MSTAVEDSETVMLIRAILASKKYPITMAELQSRIRFRMFIDCDTFNLRFLSLQEEYFDANGTCIPFKEYGFPTVIDMIKALPKKIQMQRFVFFFLSLHIPVLFFKRIKIKFLKLLVCHKKCISHA
jgi:hypothetical protein